MNIFPIFETTFYISVNVQDGLDLPTIMLERIQAPD